MMKFVYEHYNNYFMKSVRGI